MKEWSGPMRKCNAKDSARSRRRRKEAKIFIVSGQSQLDLIAKKTASWVLFVLFWVPTFVCFAVSGSVGFSSFNLSFLPRFVLCPDLTLQLLCSCSLWLLYRFFAAGPKWTTKMLAHLLSLRRKCLIQKRKSNLLSHSIRSLENAEPTWSKRQTERSEGWFSVFSSCRTSFVGSFRLKKKAIKNKNSQQFAWSLKSKRSPFHLQSLWWLLVWTFQV